MRRAALALIAAVVLAAGASAAHAQARIFNAQPGPYPDDQVQSIDLYTFGRGAVIFEKFGHAAICLHYTAHPITCFNYGITEFGGPPFPMVWNFLRGHQKFWVATQSLDDLLYFYEGFEDRDVWVQQLFANDVKAQRQIEAKLWHDYLPENRYYYYDHFADNCTTRLRDMIDAASGGKLAAGSDADYPETFRRMGREGLAEFPPIIGISDFVVGRTLDRHPTMWEAMFHPDILRQQVAEKLGATPHLVYKRKGPDFPTDGPNDRGWVLLIALAFYLPLGLAVWRGWKYMPLTLVWATIPLVLMGTLIWTLAIISSIPGLRWNEAIFLFMPFDVLLPILRGEARRKFAQIRAGMVVWASIFCAVGIFKQPLWIPIICAFVPHALVAWIEPMLAASRARPKDAALASSSTSAVAKAS